jgi:FkbM family methyltransferase
LYVKALDLSGKNLNAVGAGFCEESSMQLGKVIDEFLDRKTVVIDVGCRWGFSDNWKQLAPAVRLFGFDPDEDECRRLTALNVDDDTTLVPVALGRRCGPETLYLTAEPACSSIYQPDPYLTEHRPELNCAKEVGTTIVNMMTLDAWAAESGVTCIDFLKLDVQGAELDVLLGGEASLKNVRALEVEVEFNPIYLNQPLFGDVDAFLRKKGFVLWRLANLVHYSGEPGKDRSPGQDVLYYDSKPISIQPMPGQLVWGHAYYIRPEAAYGGVDMTWEDSLRDASIFMVLGFYDLMASLIENAIAKGPNILAHELSVLDLNKFVP